MDIYCGIGTISLCAAKNAKSVVGVEIVERAIEDAKENAVKNGIENAIFTQIARKILCQKLIEKANDRTWLFSIRHVRAVMNQHSQQ